ncbi:hypothetical protein B0H67DRAFT_183076 [Lasiosphaeris hirsuta]|uniref:Uncharacterized protein n=1 Tax=Lasiosphaeris hirsuta TaxID=260670 RepID=A0AA40AQV6_9PEZI|nr:hypothetical protein B0H67DRAFT_183076 [Lasiosphaeris hirsuta]
MTGRKPASIHYPHQLFSFVAKTPLASLVSIIEAVPLFELFSNTADYAGTPPIAREEPLGAWGNCPMPLVNVVNGKPGMRKCSERALLGKAPSRRSGMPDGGHSHIAITTLIHAHNRNAKKLVLRVSKVRCRHYCQHPMVYPWATAKLELICFPHHETLNATAAPKNFHAAAFPPPLGPLRYTYHTRGGDVFIDGVGALENSGRPAGPCAARP